MPPSDIKYVKCVVWDLDNTLWDGVLLEEKVTLRPETLEVLGELDRRGILHSIASKNDVELAADRTIHPRLFIRRGEAPSWVTPVKNQWLPPDRALSVAMARARHFRRRSITTTPREVKSR